MRILLSALSLFAKMSNPDVEMTSTWGRFWRRTTGTWASTPSTPTQSPPNAVAGPVNEPVVAAVSPPLYSSFFRWAMSSWTSSHNPFVSADGDRGAPASPLPILGPALQINDRDHNLSRRVEQLENTVDRLGGSVTRLEGSVDRLEHTVAGIAASIKQIEHFLDGRT